ncbi:MAG: sulfur transferase domain-containing protein [Planctomycetota bacterium]
MFKWPCRFSVATPAVLLRSDLPTLEQFKVIQERYGVRTIIALLDWGEYARFPRAQALRDFAGRNGIAYVHMPVGTPQPEDVARFCRIVSDPANRPVFVHCVHGEVRTGLMVALYRVEQEGWSLERAQKEMLEKGMNQSPRNQPYIDFLLRYASQRK